MTTVELELDHAKTLVRALRYAEAIPALTGASTALRAAVEEAEHPTTSLLDEFRTGWRAGAERARPRPQWDNVAKATRIIAATVASDPAFVARSDALGAYVRDTFDALGLSLYDEETLYVAVTMASLLVEMTDNGRKNGQVSADVVEAVAKVSQSFVASILSFLPPEARG